jgi:preprotein translocase subunit Sss1
MLFLLQPGTPEFSITVVTLAIGLVFVGVVVVLVRWFGR